MKKIVNTLAIIAFTAIRFIVLKTYELLKEVFVGIFFPSILTIIFLFGILYLNGQGSPEFAPVWSASIIICLFGLFISKRNKKKYLGALLYIFAWGIACHLYSTIGTVSYGERVVIPIMKYIAFVVLVICAILSLFELYYKIPIFSRKRVF